MIFRMTGISFGALLIVAMLLVPAACGAGNMPEPGFGVRSWDTTDGLP